MTRLLSIQTVFPTLFALTLAFSAAPAPTADVQGQMLLAIADAADHGLTTVPDAALSGALGRASALTSIHVDATQDHATVELQLSDAPDYALSLDNAGKSLRVDLANTVVVPDLQTLAINNGNTVSGVTATLCEIHPEFITRVEIALAATAAVQARVDGQRLILTLTPGANGISYDTTPRNIAAARVHEIALRHNDAWRDMHHTVATGLTRSHRQLEQAKLALLESDLAGVAPAADTAAPSNTARKDFEQAQAQTALLETDYQALINRRAGAVDRAIRQLSEPALSGAAVSERLAAFQAAEQAFENDLRATSARVEEQAESNALLTRRFEQQQILLTARDARTPDAGLERLDHAFAAMRTQPAAETDARQARGASSDVSAVGQAPMALPEFDQTAHAALDRDQAPLEPPAPRSHRTTEHHIDMDAFSRPDTMAVLRSSPEELAAAEDAGVIKLAQQQGGPVTDVQNGRPATPIREKTPASGPRRYRVPKTTGTRPAFNLYNEDMPADQDPLRQLVNIDFRDMDLSNVVSLLAEKGHINVIGSADLTGKTVTANLKNIPLGRAIEIVLRMNGLGIVEEAGVYRITTYEEAVAAQRETRMIFLQNAQAKEVKDTLDGILAGDVNGSLVSVSANPSTNVIIVSGPLESVEELEGVVSELDVADPVVPTVTMPIKLNYSEPVAMLPVIQPMLSDEGKVSADARSRHLIVTDIPVKVQEIQALIKSIDLPVKQVSIDAMIVDAELKDNAETGVDWFLNTRHTQGIDTDEDGIADIQKPDFRYGSSFPITNPSTAGTLAFGIITDSLGLRAEIAARVESTNSELLANPKIVTVENQPATINISEEIPYQELTQTSQGGQIASTDFKDVGTVLTVTPRVTHDDHILVGIEAKHSNTAGLSVTGVPIEAKRQATTTLRLKDGQSIFIGGLRSFDDETSNAKVPVLGDIPGLNLLFKSQSADQKHTELLIFMTCNVLPDDHYPELTPYQKDQFDKLGGKPRKVDGTRELINTYTHPQEYRDPIWKWRRTK